MNESCTDNYTLTTDVYTLSGKNKVLENRIFLLMYDLKTFEKEVKSSYLA